jgi:hypothetical protein
MEKIKQFIPKQESLGANKESIVKIHEACYQSLTTENQKKFNDAAKAAKQIAQEFCQKHNLPYMEYNFYLFDYSSKDRGGSYKTSHLDQSSYIDISKSYLEEWDYNRTVRCLLHELMHALVSKNETKYSEKAVYSVSGLRYNQINFIDHELALQEKQEFLAKLNGKLDIENFDDLQRYVFDIILESQKGDMSITRDVLRNMLEDSIIDNTPFRIKKSEGKVLGIPLDEAINDYIVAVEAAKGDNKLLEKHFNEVYVIYIGWIRNIINSLNVYQVGLGEDFYDAILESKKTGLPNPIIKFFFDNFGLKIPPKELLEINDTLVEKIIDTIKNHSKN